MENAWGIQWGPGEKQAGLSASACSFLRTLVCMPFAFSFLLLLLFAPELG